MLCGLLCVCFVSVCACLCVFPKRTCSVGCLCVFVCVICCEVVSGVACVSCVCVCLCYCVCVLCGVANVMLHGVCLSVFVFVCLLRCVFLRAFASDVVCVAVWFVVLCVCVCVCV